MQRRDAAQWFRKFLIIAKVANQGVVKKSEVFPWDDAALIDFDKSRRHGATGDAHVEHADEESSFRMQTEAAVDFSIEVTAATGQRIHRKADVRRKGGIRPEAAEPEQRLDSGEAGETGQQSVQVIDAQGQLGRAAVNGGGLERTEAASQVLDLRGRRFHHRQHNRRGVGERF